jgi:hypothetical protein
MATTPRSRTFRAERTGLEEVGLKPVAKVGLVQNRSARSDVLAEFIPLRQTNRKAYAGPLLSADEEATLRRQAESDDFELLIITEPEEMRPLLDFFYRAWEIEATTPACTRSRGSGSASTRTSGGRSGMA